MSPYSLPYPIHCIKNKNGPQEKKSCTADNVPFSPQFVDTEVTLPFRGELHVHIRAPPKNHGIHTKAVNLSKTSSVEERHFHPTLFPINWRKIVVCVDRDKMARGTVRCAGQDKDRKLGKAEDPKIKDGNTEIHICRKGWQWNLQLVCVTTCLLFKGGGAKDMILGNRRACITG